MQYGINGIGKWACHVRAAEPPRDAELLTLRAPHRGQARGRHCRGWWCCDIMRGDGLRKLLVLYYYYYCYIMIIIIIVIIFIIISLLLYDSLTVRHEQ